ncbi:MAG: hypothetical protein R3E87_12725 [Burkholderiaceae bacterium]
MIQPEMAFVAASFARGREQGLGVGCALLVQPALEWRIAVEMLLCNKQLSRIFWSLSRDTRRE